MSRTNDGPVPREPTREECFHLLRGEIRRRLSAQQKWRGLPALIDALHALRSGSALVSCDLPAGTRPPKENGPAPCGN